MSTFFSQRPLSVLPFIAADAGLLLTAGLIAWGTNGELTGGPLLAVVVCVGLGAVLAVLPFVLNDAYQRDAALAERQRELAELVNSSNAHASRWGTQWAAAATGLQDAADLAGRSLAAAERLPAAFEETAAALTRKLTEIEQQAHTRAERAADLESARAAELHQQLAGQAAAQAVQTAQAAQASEHASALATRENAFAAQLATLTGQLSALTTHQAQTATHESALTAREVALADQLGTLADQLTRVNAEVASVSAAAATVKTGLQEFARLDASVRAQGPAIAAALAEFPVAAEQARAARQELAAELAAAPAQLAAVVERRVSEAEVRLGATTTALTDRLAEVESALARLVNQLHLLAEKAAAAPVTVAAIAVPAPTPLTPEPIEESLAAPITDLEAPIAPVLMATGSVAAAIEVAADRVVETAAVIVDAVVDAAGATRATTPTAAVNPAASAAKTPVRSDQIMDPFIIPTNGYAALADAMDLGEA
jgi:chromosome segregation ATPase